MPVVMTCPWQFHTISWS